MYLLSACVFFKKNVNNIISKIAPPEPILAETINLVKHLYPV